MSAAAIIALILTSIPQGAKALDAIKQLVEQWVVEQARKDFLAGCVDMVRAILDNNLTNPIPFTPDELKALCGAAIRIYGTRMGFPVDEAVITALGVNN